MAFLTSIYKKANTPTISVLNNIEPSSDIKGIGGGYTNGFRRPYIFNERSINTDKSTGLIYRYDQDFYDLQVSDTNNQSGILNKSLTFPENLTPSTHKFISGAFTGTFIRRFVYNFYSPEASTKFAMNHTEKEDIEISSSDVGIIGEKSYSKFIKSLDDQSLILKFRNKWRESSVFTTTKGTLGIKPTDSYNIGAKYWINSRFSGIQTADIYSSDSVIEPARTLSVGPEEIPSDSNQNTVYEKKIDQNPRMKRFYDSMVGGNLSNTTQTLKNSKHIHTLNKNPVHDDNDQFIQNLNDALNTKFNNITKPYFRSLRNISSTNRYVDMGDAGISKITGEHVSENSREKKLKFGNYGVDKQRAGESFESRIDKLNSLQVLNGEPNHTDNPDLIRFSFHDVVNNKAILFRSTLKSISDNGTAEWSDVKYLGRADKVYIYQGITRSVSFNFRVYASSKGEMRPMWQRINYLYGMIYPSKILKPESITDGNIIQGPFGINIPPYVKLTIGNLYHKQPILINSIGLTVPDESSWEIDDDMQLPMMVEISLTTTFLEKDAPQANIAHFDKLSENSYLVAGNI